MFDIREYCDTINVDKPDIFELCKERGIIPKKFMHYDELGEEHQRLYEREVRFYYQSY